MRPNLILTAVVLMAVAAFGQQPFRPGYGPCVYGCGPSIPLLTTPEMSLQQFSPNPVGASNATTGLIAGATNSTLSQIQGSTSSVYTVAVWYQGGGAPLITPEVNLWPETIGREGRPRHEPMHEAMREERAWEERPREERAREDRMHGERLPEGHAAREEAHGDWIFFTGREHTTDSTSVVKGFKKAARVYNNGDVTRQNDKNGTVKYDDKTEKM